MPCALPAPSTEIDAGARRTFPFDPNASKRLTTPHGLRGRAVSGERYCRGRDQVRSGATSSRSAVNLRDLGYSFHRPESNCPNLAHWSWSSASGGCDLAQPGARSEEQLCAFHSEQQSVGNRNHVGASISCTWAIMRSCFERLVGPAFNRISSRSRRLKLGLARPAAAPAP
jgi:hypothetical protein